MSNYFYHKENAQYPKDPYARPQIVYPEYPYSELGFSKEENDVYEMIRGTFIALGLDREHIGQKEWNPLGEYIKEGNTVLLKPNLVKHQNLAVDGPEGMECMTTQASVIRCMLDYVFIALKESGKVIVADAPVQGCDFEALLENGQYKKIEEFYQKAGKNIVFEDLRSHSSVQDKEIVKGKELKPSYAGIEINLSEKSNFYEAGKEGRKREKRLRITNYDHHELYKYHSGKNHVYRISEAALQADVIINLPKPKTHRKAGYTGALKNFVGVNTAKEYLPHHTKGSYLAKQGDEFFSKEAFSRLKSQFRDWRDVADSKEKYGLSRKINLLWKVCRRLLPNHEKYSEGSWWGNDTIWRMVLDINRIILYADKNGHMTDSKQRKILHLGDMLICGEKEGPMEPSPKRVGGILFADNAVEFDSILVTLMGLDETRLPVLYHAQQTSYLFDNNIRQCIIHSNETIYQGNRQKIKENFGFVASAGWQEAIGKRDEIK